MLCECKCKLNDRKSNLNQKKNNDKCQCECKNLKEQFNKYIDVSVIAFDKIIDITKKVLTKAVPSTTVPTNSFILLAFFIFYLPNCWYLLVFTVYMIKYGAKQKYLLPSHVTNNKSKEVFY